MRIAMILPSLANTGPGIVAKDLCTEYVAEGHTCKVFYFDDILQLKMPCPTERIGFRYRIDFGQYDIVHSHMLRADGYVWYHTLRKCPAQVRFVTTLHNPVSYKAFRTGYNPLWSLAGSLSWKIFLRAFDRIVTLNQDTACALKHLYGQKVEIIHNGRNIPICQSVPSAQDRSRINELKSKYTVIGTVSSITRRKGLIQMVEALPRLPEYAFVAVGDGDQMQELQQKAEQLHVSERCVWLGYRDNATDYMSLFDLFVMCTHSEGFPLALIEAAAYGLPTVLSDIPILTSIIGAPNVAFYHLEDIEDLCAKIREVHENSSLYSNNIRKYYEQKLTAGIMAGKYIDVYRSLQEQV